MPGIAGLLDSIVTKQSHKDVLEAMAARLVYDQGQTGHLFLNTWFAGATVDHRDWALFSKSASAYRDSVLCLIDGELFIDASEAPAGLSSRSPCIQRAEYCLQLYLELGVGFVKQLNGSFAIAVFDGRERNAYVWSDRFGSRPLYYFCDGTRLVFSSRLASVLAADHSIGRKYNRDAVAELLLSERVWGRKTLFKDIQRLLPASCLTWNALTVKEAEYLAWRAGSDTAKSAHARKDAAAELLARVNRSVQRQTSDNAKTMLMASGGLDSRLILACCPPTVVAGTFSNKNHETARETRVASSVARTLGHPLLLLERTEQYYATIPTLAVEVVEGQCSMASCHSLGVHRQMVEAGIQAVVTGLWFDTMLKGMYSSSSAFGASYENEPGLVKSRRIARTLADTSSFHKVLHQDLLMLALSRELRERAALAKERFIAEMIQMAPHECGTARWAEHLAMVNLYANPMWGFARGLGTSFACRCPALDNDLFAFARQTPAEWKTGGRLVRMALRLINPKLAWLSDANTGVPAGLCPPWNWALSGLGRGLRRLGSSLLGYLTWPNRVERGRVGCAVFNDTSWHDINALMLRCPEYRDLVKSTVERLDPELFDRGNVESLLENDLQASKPRFRKLFELILSFALFDKTYGPSVERETQLPVWSNLCVTELAEMDSDK